MSVINSELTDRTFEQTIRSRVPVLIDFWGDNCIPCKMMEPIIDEMKSKYDGRMTVVKANIKNCSKAVEQYKIMSVPTLMVFKDGKPVEKSVGVIRGSLLQKKIESIL